MWGAFPPLPFILEFAVVTDPTNSWSDEETPFSYAAGAAQQDGGKLAVCVAKLTFPARNGSQSKRSACGKLSI